MAQKIHDWNQEFQSLVSQLRTSGSDMKSVYRKLGQLGSDFVYAAKTYGQIIIAENCLQNFSKTIRPNTLVRGVAGGDKYICNNILFKFAINGQKNIYRSDENAMKAAGNELRYLAQLFEINLSNLHIPLMCTIDWCGYRLIAISVLPIRDDTLIYGSSNAGIDIINKDPAFENLMKEVAEKLNLVRHKCGTPYTREAKFLYTCVDLEGHRDQKGRYYVVDVARLFPPEFIDVAVTSASTTQISSYSTSSVEQPPFFLFRHLRPELVRKWRAPLNPDSFSQFVAAEDPTTRQQHENDITECTRHMKEFVIPQFAKSLVKKYSDANVNELRFLTLSRFILELHQAGINIRHLGLVKTCLESCLNESPEISSHLQLKALIRLEMICRVIKNHLNENMRAKMKEIVRPSSRPFNEIIINFYNMMLSNAHFWTLVSPDATTSVGNVPFVKKLILDKFGPYALNTTEKDPNESIAPSEPRELILRLQELMGVELYPSAMTNLQYTFENQINPVVSDPLSTEDIKQRDVRVKHLPFILYAEAISDFLETQTTKDRDNKIRLLEKAIQKFENSGLSSLYTSDKVHLKEVMNLWGDTLKEYAMMIELDSVCRDPVAENRQKIGMAKFYFEIALEKYQRTEDSIRILNLADDATLKLVRLRERFVPLRRSFGNTEDFFSVEDIPTEAVEFLKVILGDDYFAKLTSGQEFTRSDAEILAQWGYILYRVALKAKNSAISAPLFQASGKYYLKSVELDPQLFPPLSSWIRNVKEQDVGHVFYIARMDPKFAKAQPTKKQNQRLQNVISYFKYPIEKFVSSWVPNLSFDTFRELVQNTALKSLTLNATQTDPQIFENLSSFANRFVELQELSLHNCGGITSTNVKKMLEKADKLERLVVHRCPQIKWEDFDNFKIGDRQIQVVVDLKQTSTQSTLPTEKGYQSFSTALTRSKKKITHLFPEDYHILTSLIEYSERLKKFMRKCEPTKCPKFRVSGMYIYWDKDVLPPSEYYKKFVEHVQRELALKKEDTDGEAVTLADPNQISEWPQKKTKIYRSLFYLCLHLLQCHPQSDFKYEFFLFASQVVNLGKRHHLLIRPEDWWKNENTLKLLQEKLLPEELLLAIIDDD
jgi:hypothetical protein